MNWGKVRSFLWGGLVGGLLGLVLAPRRRRARLRLAVESFQDAEAFASAPCYLSDNEHT